MEATDAVRASLAEAGPAMAVFRVMVPVALLLNATARCQERGLVSGNPPILAQLWACPTV